MSRTDGYCGIMIDNSRNAVMKPETVKQMICLLEKLGYNALMLYTEDTYEVNNQPYFGYLRGRYSKAELKELDAFAAAHNVELIPCVQTLAHLKTIMRWSYSAFCDVDDILCVGDDRTYALIEDIFATINECFTSKIVNIGMDEAAMIGLGKYLQQHGYRDGTEIFMEHLHRVSEIAKKYDYTLCIWSDMFYRLAVGKYESCDGTEEIDASVKIPDNVQLIYWDYFSSEKSHYDRMFQSHRKLQEDVWFAGGLWTWPGFAPHNSFSIKTSTAAIESCKTNNVKNVFFTSWGDNGGECSRFSILPALFYNACLMKGITDEQSIKHQFNELFGISFDDFMLLDLPYTPNDQDGIVNAEKYLLYNDCFLGLMDRAIQPGDRQRYEACAKRLEKHIGHPQWGTLFRTMYALCNVLSIKAEIGLKSRHAYQEKNREELQRLVPEYERLLDYLHEFYEAYEAQWMLENKPHGFDVQDLRIGGAIQRVCHCLKRLQSYLSGTLDSIPELDEQILNIEGGGDTAGRHLHYNSWSLTSTVNII